MAKHDLDSIPIVKDDGELVGVLSGRNLASSVVRKSTPNEALRLFQKPVLDFIAVSQHPNTLKESVTCSADDTFKTVISKIIGRQARQTWILRENKVIGILSLGDILSIFK